MENSNEKSEKTVIVLNAMYSGKYLNDNMGHEIINLFKADNEIEVDGVKYQNFIYLNPYGNFNSAYKGRIKDMLMVISVPKKNMFEVVGKATDLVDIFEPVTGFNPKLENKGENIKPESPEDKVIKSQQSKIGELEYGESKLSELFDKDQQQAIFVTFAAKSVCRPKKRLFIKFLPPEKDSGKSDIPTIREWDLKDRYEILLTSSRKAQQSQKQYFDPRCSKEEEEDVNLLNKLMNNKYWSSEKGGTTAKSLKDKKLTFNKDSLFNICKIGDDELAFSNALAFYIEKYPHLFSKTFDLALNKSTDKKIIVEREWNHIDIYVKVGDQRRIIENKIHSGINCSATEVANNKKQFPKAKKESQLGRYWTAVTKELKVTEDTEEAFVKAFLLCPDYKYFELNSEKDDFIKGDKYTIIPYSELHRCLVESDVYKEEDKPDRNFQDFVNALKKHTYKSIPELKYAEMEDQFKARINKQ
ncbi:MAG: hypothetical protein UD961_03820 [Bacteroidales bacterium]|nr:hypothetical protein [Bacteroidales bacterium]